MPHTYRVRVLIPRGRLPHTAEDSPHLLDDEPSITELHIREGGDGGPDELILVKRGFESSDLARSGALAAKWGLMRTGLIAGVPMLFGDDTSSSQLSQAAIEHIRAETGTTIRDDVHGIDIFDETEVGPHAYFRAFIVGRAGVPIDAFLAELTVSLDVIQPASGADSRLGLAIEVFMAACIEKSPRSKFLDFVTVLEILAEDEASSDEVAAVVDAALAQLDERRDVMDDAEFRSLEGALGRLRKRSISRSIKALGADLATTEIPGYTGSNIETFLGHCYGVRSTLVHDGLAPPGADPGRLAGDLFIVLKHMLNRRIADMIA